MSVKPKLWTISGLSVELGRNQKLIARALARVPPDGSIDATVGRCDGWLLSTAIEALRRHEGTSTALRQASGTRRAGAPVAGRRGWKDYYGAAHCRVCGALRLEAASRLKGRKSKCADLRIFP